MAYDSDNVNNICISVTVSILLICLAVATTKIVHNVLEENTKREQIHFSGGYEQRMVVGYSYPVWVKIDESDQNDSQHVEIEKNK